MTLHGRSFEITKLQARGLGLRAIAPESKMGASNRIARHHPAHRTPQDASPTERREQFTLRRWPKIPSTGHLTSIRARTWLQTLCRRTCVQASRVGRCSTPRFTSANARSMAARSVAARKAAEAERLASPAPIPLPATPPADTDPCVILRVSRVRKQLDRLDELLTAEKDPQRIDRLASAQHRLAEPRCKSVIALAVNKGGGERAMCRLVHFQPP